jgi:hypothetical protein
VRLPAGDRLECPSRHTWKEVASLAGNIILYHRTPAWHNQPENVPEELCYRLELEPPMNQQLFEFEEEEYDDSPDDDDFWEPYGREEE